MRIYIGITHNLGVVRNIITRHHGRQESLTTFGPFASSLDAYSWLSYLKSRIGAFQEIMPEQEADTSALWYGFTFEKSPHTTSHR